MNILHGFSFRCIRCSRWRSRSWKNRQSSHGLRASGTIPDLDVVGKFFISIDNLAFHRGIAHSIFFSVIAAILLGWLVHRIYASSITDGFYARGLAVLTITIALDFIFQRIWMVIRFQQFY